MLSSQYFCFRNHALLKKSRFNGVRTGLLRCLVIAITLFVARSAFGGGDDLLAGTETQLLATLSGTGKKYIYLAEGVLSIAAYIRTKNLLVLTGILIVALFLNIVLKFASGEMG